MTKSLSFVSSVIVATALVLPPAVEAQASRRGGSSESGGSSGSSRGGSGGSDTGGRVATPRASPPAPAPSGGGGESRPAAPSGGSATAPASSSGTRTAPAARGIAGSSEAARVRTTQAIRGTAQPRGDVTENPQHPFSPWGRWYPWYYYSPSSYYGHVVYSPWLFGGTVWSWNRYGWHAPYLYGPYDYFGYMPYYGSSWTDSDREPERTGSLRLRVNPSHARVYVDGALAGVADDFGGLGNHLTIPAGRHQIELRADGYQTYTAEIDVKAGRTQTERVTLKKQ